MKIERYKTKKRNSNWLIGCGCLFTLAALAGLGAALVIIIPGLPRLSLIASGFQDQGETNNAFAQAGTPIPPLAVVESQPDAITIGAGSYGSSTIITGDNIQAQVGSGEMRITTDEGGLLAYCRQVSSICTTTGDDAIRNARFDLRPGGMIVYADVRLPQVNTWQPVGIVLRFNGSVGGVSVSGVDVDGRLYAAPPDGIGAIVRETEQRANDLLAQFSASSSAGNYDLQTIYADDTTLTLVLR